MNEKYRSNPWSGLCYFILQWLLIVLLLLSIISVFLSFFPSCQAVLDIASRLSMIFQPQALSSAIGAVGVTGIVFGWLIAHAEDRICGVRYVDLVEWTYPNFFLSYFLLFIPTTMVGIFAGKAELFWPTLFSFLGVICHIALLIRVCWVFVIWSDQREKKAFSYYRKQMGSEEKSEIHNEQDIDKLLLKAADYTHMLIRKEHQVDKCNELLNLWVTGLNIILAKTRYSSENSLCWDDLMIKCCMDEHDGILQCIQLSRELWDALLEGESTPQARAEVIAPLLSVIDTVTEAYARISILLGLIQVLLDEHIQLELAVEEIAKLLKYKQQMKVAKELTGGLVAALMVHYIIEPEIAEEAIHRMYTLLRPQLGKLVEDLCDFRAASETNNFWTGRLLFYGEWVTRNMLHISLNHYLLQVSDYFVDKSLRQNPLFDLCCEGWHIEMMACLIHQMEKENCHSLEYSDVSVFDDMPSI